MYDYTNKTIYLGIDVHKRSYSVTAVCDSEIVKSGKLAGSPETLVNYCNRFFPNAKIISAYEAGFCGFYLHRFLNKNGIENIVVHAASIEIGARDRVKTDKRDSLKIATQLSVGRLKCIYIPTEEQEYNRLVTRCRDTLVKKRTRVACQIKSLLNLFGLILWDNRQKMSQKHIKKLLAKEYHPDLKLNLETLCTEWLEITNNIKKIDRHLKVQHTSKLFKTYFSAPGIGVTTASIFMNELGDMSQFPSEDKLFSYTGLTPSQYSSGEAIRLGHISHQGKAVLRRLLVQSAWIAIKHDKCLTDYHARLTLRMGSKRAIIAVARKLIGKIRACIRNGVMYQINQKTTIHQLNTDTSVNIDTGELIDLKSSVG